MAQATPATTLAEDKYGFVMDDLTAQYMPLDNDGMEGDTKEKHLRRLRELREAFQRWFDQDRYRCCKEGNDAPGSLPADFTSKWYHATRENSIAVNVISAYASSTNQEARRLREI